MPTPWNNWYHVNGNTYGTWLRGDPRGWRARHHREHVEGDYKKPPPPGTYDRLQAYSKQLMDREPVKLSVPARTLARDAMVEALLHHHIELIALAIDSHHYHILARFPDHNPRKWIGIGKARSARVLSSAGLVSQGGVWAIRCKCTPINDRAHQLATARYILAHAHRGAAVWRINSRQT